MEQLTIRLEIGQGGTVHFFIAWRGMEAEEFAERRAVAIASARTKERCPLHPERRGTQRPLHNSSCCWGGDCCHRRGVFV